MQKIWFPIIWQLVPFGLEYLVANAPQSAIKIKVLIAICCDDDASEPKVWLPICCAIDTETLFPIFGSF